MAALSNQPTSGSRGSTSPDERDHRMSWAEQLLDPILNRMRGELIGVLGERGVGKTHLQTFLREGRIPATYVGTQTQTRLSPSRAQLWSFEDTQGKPKSVRLKGGYDVPGSAGAVEAWK